MMPQPSAAGLPSLYGIHSAQQAQLTYLKFLKQTTSTFSQRSLLINAVCTIETQEDCQGASA
jgi:hypothetical protein